VRFFFVPAKIHCFESFFVLEKFRQFFNIFFVIAEILDLFIKGHLKLNPVGQRPMILSASMHVVRDMLYNNVRPMSMLYNKDFNGVYDVADGLQRSSKIIATLMGILPVKQSDGSMVYLCAPNDPNFGWRTFRDMETTPETVKSSIDLMLAAFGINPETVNENPTADTTMLIKCTTIRVSVQVVEQWPARSAACLAQLQSMNTTTHSLGETAFESTNALTMAVAKYEAEWMPHLINLGLGSQDKNKSLFLHTLRGIACAIPEVEFVNKANDIVGFGDFMSSIFHFMMHPLPDGFEADLIVNGLVRRLGEFAAYKELNAPEDRRIKRWKPDMIASMIFMLTLGEDVFPDETVFDVLKRIESPRMHLSRGFAGWFKSCYSKKDNLIEIFAMLIRESEVHNTASEPEAPAVPTRKVMKRKASDAGPSNPQAKAVRIDASSSSSSSSDDSDSD
jgi:hypothetical protein